MFPLAVSLNLFLSNLLVSGDATCAHIEFLESNWPEKEKNTLYFVCLLALFRSRPRVLANDGNRTHEQAEHLAQARIYRLPIIGFQKSVPQRGSAALDEALFGPLKTTNIFFTSGIATTVSAKPVNRLKSQVMLKRDLRRFEIFDLSELVGLRLCSLCQPHIQSGSLPFIAIQHMLSTLSFLTSTLFFARRKSYRARHVQDSINQFYNI